MEYKITFKNQFIAIRSAFYLAIISIGVFFFFYHITDYDMALGFLPYLLGYYLALSIPAVYVHIEYWRTNKNDVVEINKLKRTITINGNAVINFEEIEKITVYMSFVMYRKGFVKFAPFDNYQYALLQFKDGKKYIFTSLMAPNVEDIMTELDVPLERQRRFVPSISLK